MKKSFTNSIEVPQRSFANVVAVPVPPLAAVLSDVKSAFFGLCVHAGKKVLAAMMEADRVELCGAKGHPDAQRRAGRGGHTRSWMTLGGRRVVIHRPRARAVAGEELSLAGFRWAAGADPLNAATLSAIAAGVSTRRYAGTLDVLPLTEVQCSVSRSAVSRRFVALLAEQLGEVAFDQRCQVHKLRNVLEHLPEHMRASVRQAVNDAWNSRDPALALRQLERLARSLEREHPGAAGSLREGLEETLTVQRLGIEGALYLTLRSTNPIENLNGAVAHHTRNVKRWRDGQMVLRWVGARASLGELSLSAPARLSRPRQALHSPQTSSQRLRGEHRTQGRVTSKPGAATALRSTRYGTSREMNPGQMCLTTSSGSTIHGVGIQRSGRSVRISSKRLQKA